MHASPYFKALQQNLFHFFAMLSDSIGIPRVKFHHQILFHAIKGIVLIEFPLSRWREIAEAGVFVMADKTQITKRIEHFGFKRNKARQRVLRIVMLNRTAKGEFVSFDRL